MRPRQRWGVALLAVVCASSAAAAEEAAVGTLSPKAVEALGLIESNDPYRQQLGFLRLEALREAGAAGSVRAYAEDRNPSTRGWALRALAAIEGPAAIPLLLSKLQQDKKPYVRQAALLGLEPLQQADPAVLAAFLKALKDRHPNVRMTAADIVSRIDDPRAREAILTRRKRERSKDVRRVLAMAAARVTSAR